ncbi:alpha/beta hydrolase [Campylobacter sp. MIT 99-7217]|uniref:alpha/beta hydrolase n=1 Tax=Campylobacter sp. MIT 99-7217 TaxID=535091 RepID=UPI001C8D57C7|nr:alpha/beta hydrolase [Campylobacter sp. MIT 99-7217]
MVSKTLSCVLLSAVLSSAYADMSLNSAKLLEQNYKAWQVVNPSPEVKANIAKNPFGLVYEGAISKNEKGKVNLKSVSYYIGANKIAANLYLPANFNEKKKYKALVIAHPNGGVKEQVAGLFAQKLAQLGFITLAFDAAYQGASEGLPRNVDLPQNRVEDIRGAADFLLSLSFVDSENLGVLGICGGGGYTLKAAQSDKRFKAVATLSAFNTGLVRREGFLGSQKDSIQSRLKEASKARSDERIKGVVAYTGEAPKKTSEAELAKISSDLYREGLVYYGDTHAHPNSSFAYTSSSLLV